MRLIKPNGLFFNEPHYNNGKQIKITITVLFIVTSCCSSMI